MTIDSVFDFTEEDAQFVGIAPNQDSYRRRLVIIMIDLSGSMNAIQPRVGRPINALNEQLETWVPEVRAQGSGALREVEFAVMTFSGAGVGILNPEGIRIVGEQRRGDQGWPDPDGRAFVPAAELALPLLEATGSTPMVRALSAALALGDQHVLRLADRGIETGQVRLLLFSDGAPNELAAPDGEWESIIDEIHRRRQDRRNQLFAFGVPGADEQLLRQLAGDDGYRALDGFDFAQLLALLLLATSSDDPYRAIFDYFSADSTT